MTLQLVNILDSIINSSNLRKKTTAVLLDIEKESDKVWHPGLIFKLIVLGISTQLINIIKSFLFSIKINDSSSLTKPIDVVVPQGSCLSPHLFALYVNDLPLSLDSNVTLFADDTLFYSTCTSMQSIHQHVQQSINFKNRSIKYNLGTISGESQSTLLKLHQYTTLIKSYITLPRLKFKIHSSTGYIQINTLALT